MASPVITVKNLSKQYRLGNLGLKSFIEDLKRFFPANKKNWVTDLTLWIMLALQLMKVRLSVSLDVTEQGSHFC